MPGPLKGRPESALLRASVWGAKARRSDSWGRGNRPGSRLASGGEGLSHRENSTRTWRVLNLPLGIDEPDSALRGRAAQRAGVAPEMIRGLRIAHKALDARRRGAERRIRFVVHVDVQLDAELESRPNPAFAQALRSGRVIERAPQIRLEAESFHASLRGQRVAVVGAGPAGLFAALVLARSGVEVDLVERGPAIAERSRALARFHRTREMDPEANLLFGEGGAGTYSDGKIYTRIDHPLEHPILEEWIACGAPEEIAYDARAHIGTDRLHSILPRLRMRLEEAGVRFHWCTRLEGFLSAPGRPGRIRGLITSRGEIECAAVFLALGHSARDSVQALAGDGLVLEARPFQLGVRIEHPQELIDRARYGDARLASRLGSAYYGLTSRAGSGAAAAHSFCMCPGGQIVAGVNEDGLLSTNGMSNSLHSSPHANAALVTTLGPKEFGPGAWAGVDFREKLEREFFAEGGGDWSAPAQSAADFLAGRVSSDLGATSYRFGIRPGRIDALLPAGVRNALARALTHFEGKIPGYAGQRGILVGIESRSSSALRIPRDAESLRARSFENVLPIGEGAGYAGGIMSAAIDGARSARKLLEAGLV